MRLDFLKGRLTRDWAYVGIYFYVAAVLAGLVLINLLADRHNTSWDSTANKRFSLSDQTTTAVRNLKGDVKITYFDLSSNFQRAKDLLDRYAALSSKVSVVYVDPRRDYEIAAAAGISVIPTVHVQAGNKREETRSATEQDLTNALIRVMKGGERTVCAVSGSGEHSLEDSDATGYSSLADLLRKNQFKVDTISLLEKAEIPATCSVLLVGGPRRDYLDTAIAAIKAYVENGGRALFLLDPPLRLGRETISENAALVKLLDDWGVTVEKNLVLDLSGIGSRFGLGPAVALVGKYESHAIVRKMQSLATAFPLARSVDTKSGASATVDKILTSQSRTYATTELGPNLRPPDPKKDKSGPFVLAVAGKYNTGKPNSEGRFVVVGSSRWLENNILGSDILGNDNLSLNMLDWLCSDEELISIRPKPPEDRRIDLKGARYYVVFYTPLGILLLVIAAGVTVWWRRR